MASMEFHNRKNALGRLRTVGVDIYWENLMVSSDFTYQTFDPKRKMKEIR